MDDVTVSKRPGQTQGNRIQDGGQGEHKTLSLAMELMVIDRNWMEKKVLIFLSGMTPVRLICANG